MAEKFIGKWKLSDSEGFDEYLKEVGVGWVTRKAATNIKPVLEIEVNGDHWKMTSTSSFTTWVCEFDIGKEFEETTADGRKLKATFTLNDGKLIEEQKAIKQGDKDSHFERCINGDGMLVITMESGGVKSVRTYVRA